MPCMWLWLFKYSKHAFVHSALCHIIPKDAILCHLAFVIPSQHFQIFFSTVKHVFLSFWSYFLFCSKLILHTNKSNHISFNGLRHLLSSFSFVHESIFTMVASHLLALSLFLSHNHKGPDYFMSCVTCATPSTIRRSYSCMNLSG